MPRTRCHPRTCGHLLLAGLAALLLAGCATLAPVQEMSDARQALRAAEEAGAPLRVPGTYQQSRRLLEQAEDNLSTGEFRQARRKANAARDLAIEARIRAGH
ncbi:protein of unknown function [Ectothiorhodospira magna]|uniref:Uncharacterized protein n=1 Tax=Ectothiorhodospira magna TaxID=867345 RepID=A0A1H9F244_9GAMM|nr:DUF4398 domain-containing protein [Ectothiorhodospira magna]SEQ32026.1 protein of unknown function [Ectothiorhodospira magna]